MELIVTRDGRLAEYLLTENSDMMFAGVVAGNNPGQVWVDDLDDPQAALVWSAGLGAFNFMGQPNGDWTIPRLREFIETTIIPFLQEKGINYFEYSCDSEAWVSVIEQVLQDREIFQSGQFVYQAGADRLIEEDVEIAEYFEAIAIDEEFFSSLGKIKNKEFLVEYLQTFWGSVENYLSQGYGYAALHDGEIASFIVSSFRYQSTQAIGVETLENYRQKGLAGSLTKLLLKDFYAQGIEPWWDCMDENIASQKTAEKAGLVRTHGYRIWWIRF